MNHNAAQLTLLHFYQVYSIDLTLHPSNLYEQKYAKHSAKTHHSHDYIRYSTSS